MFSPDQLASIQTIPTPFYYYDMELLQQTLDAVQKHGLSRGYHVHFALKANNNERILSAIRDAGLGADCVSGREIEKALDVGFTPEQIAFAGVGKTDEEIDTGLKHDIYSFNCESVQEIEVLNERAARMGKTVNISVRLNPNVEAKTHKYITTGLTENKFGVNPENLPELFQKLPELTHVKVTGIHFHIGSQITDLQPYIDLCEKANHFQELFELRNYPLSHINVGGGFGIDYGDPDGHSIPDFDSFFSVFERHLKLRDNQQLHFELGRSVVGQCGSLISRVLFIKKGITTNFAIIDAGMTELIRPALYQANHAITALTSSKPESVYDVVGPICETSDTFSKKLSLPELERGDLVAIRSAGAYGQVMSSDFNLRDRAKAIFSDAL
ncbi:MAG: diaminopimelate decarboxylase [Balneolaceae bacterium]